jgi:hypothetical protein
MKMIPANSDPAATFRSMLARCVSAVRTFGHEEIAADPTRAVLKNRKVLGKAFKSSR